MYSALVVGGDGLIGRGLCSALRSTDVEVISTTRRKNLGEIELDLGMPFNVKKLPRCDVVYLCAAISRFAACEQNPMLARHVNVTAQLELARYFFLQGAHVVFLSSNAVFNGVDEAPAEGGHPSPASVYGQLKFDAERELKILASQHSGTLSVIRLTKVLSKNLPLINNWLLSIEAGQEVEAFSDVMVSPISLNYVLDCLRRCGEIRYNGILHLSGEDELSYYELVKALAGSIGLDSTLVQAVRSREPTGQPLAHNRLSMTNSANVLNVVPQSLAGLLIDLKDSSV
jgi:dTDP-4-dehydrorhamnose reductase